MNSRPIKNLGDIAEALGKSDPADTVVVCENGVPKRIANISRVVSSGHGITRINLA